MTRASLTLQDGLWDVLTPQEAVNLALRSAHRARERGASPTAACRVASSVLARAAVQRGSRDNITCVLIDLRQGPEEGPSLAAVLAAQCSEEVALTPQRTAERRGSCPSDAAGGGGSGAGAAAAGAGGGGPMSWLSGLLLRYWPEPLGGSGGSGRASGKAADGGGGGDGACVFRASSAAARGARMSLRRASTVTPVGVCLHPGRSGCGGCGSGGAAAAAGGAPLPARSAKSSGGELRASAACGGCGAGGRVPGLQRSLSFSSYELGHVLQRSNIQCDAPAPPPPAASH
jgi:hypothetical protein